MKNTKKLDQFLSDLSPQVRIVIARVIKAERAKLHMIKPKKIKDEIRTIIKQESDSK